MRVVRQGGILRKKLTGEPESIILIPTASTALNVGREAGKIFRLFLMHPAVPLKVLGPLEFM